MSISVAFQLVLEHVDQALSVMLKIIGQDVAVLPALLVTQPLPAMHLNAHRMITVHSIEAVLTTIVWIHVLSAILVDAELTVKPSLTRLLVTVHLVPKEIHTKPAYQESAITTRIAMILRPAIDLIEFAGPCAPKMLAVLTPLASLVVIVPFVTAPQAAQETRMAAVVEALLLLLDVLWMQIVRHLWVV